MSLISSFSRSSSDSILAMPHTSQEKCCPSSERDSLSKGHARAIRGTAVLERWAHNVHRQCTGQRRLAHAFCESLVCCSSVDGGTRSRRARRRVEQEDHPHVQR